MPPVRHHITHPAGVLYHMQIALSTDPAVARPTSEHQPGPNVIAKLLAGPAMAGTKAYDSTTAAAAGSGPGSDSSRKPAADMSMPATADGNATDITVGVPGMWPMAERRGRVTIVALAASSMGGSFVGRSHTDPLCPRVRTRSRV